MGKELRLRRGRGCASGAVEATPPAQNGTASRNTHILFLTIRIIIYAFLSIQTQR